MAHPGRRRLGAVAMVTILLMGLAAADAFGSGGRAMGSRAAAFAWLRPRAVPSAWSVLPLPGSPAGLPLPRGWSPAHGDAGTRTAELTAGSGEIVGYLNATPRQGGETPANWGRFRPAHNRAEGDRAVRLLASARGLRFRGASGSCVIDSYLTKTGRRYREIACLVVGRSAQAVIVAAAPPGLWAAHAAVLERAVSSFET